ncbi:MAG: SAP domain-containing protein [Spirochaetales bacterium]|nr:SAP domain-containing protein [Spirochaetales bacterium]
MHKNITREEFTNGYWYSNELKEFGKEIGIKNYSKLRKDELEGIVIHFIKTGIIEKETKRITGKTQDKLSLDTIIENYKNDRRTKEFILQAAFKKNPELKLKSGSIYWLNRWREDKIKSGIKITYEQLINEFIKLNFNKGKLPQIPSAKMNNFITDYLKNETDSKRKDAVNEWIKLKELNIPKDYKSWKLYILKNNGAV